jgi:hypothetical protein
MDTSYFLQIFGPCLAILGAIYNCSPNRCDKAIGFGTWIVSNTTLLIWAILVGAYWIGAMYVVFCGTSVYGFWHHRRG